MSVTIKIENAIKRFGDKTIIPGLTLEIKDGEFFTLLGPSGCGKTTLLRMIAGFNSIEGGEIFFDNNVINYLPPHKRNIGMVFQNYAIFPHLSVRNNVGFGLKERKVKDPEFTERIENILSSVQILDLIERMPSQMSGGQQQRIALARAIVIEPDVLLMDEPLSNLDAKLRVEMRSVIKGIQNDKKITAVYVTHDQEEALSMSDRIAVMNFGVIQQVGTPREIYSKPANVFVATFIGSSNILEGSIKKEGDKLLLQLVNSSFELDKNKFNTKNNQRVKVNVRPHDLYFSEEGIAAAVVEVMYLGSQVIYKLDIGSGEHVELHANVNEVPHNVGDKVFVSFQKDAINVFDFKSETTIAKE